MFLLKLFCSAQVVEILECVWVDFHVRLVSGYVNRFAFPVLNVFLHVDRVLARDFSMIIQSAGMTSASIFILSHKDTVLKGFKPLLVFIPVCLVGFLLGMLLLQQIHVYLIQAFFLCLSATFVLAYFFSDDRGTLTELTVKTRTLCRINCTRN